MAAQEIKLPLLCKAIHLATLPHQPGERYGVCWGGGLPEPERGLGYLIEFTGKRTGRVLAWLRDGGYVYACAAPLEAEPDERPALSLALWRNKRDAGRVTAVDATGADARQVAEFTVRGDRYTFVDPTCDLGPTYATAACPFKEFLAVSYLAFVYIPRARGAAAEAGRTMDGVLDELLALPPADAVDVLVSAVERGERTSGFERYAARILHDVDPQAIRALASRHQLSWLRLNATGLFWINADLDEMTPEEIDLLIAFEGALNRLALIARAAREHGADALDAASEAFCVDEDWHQLRAIARQAARCLEGTGRENPLLSVCGASGARGGEWDVRTRFAYALERLLLPYRLVYRFATNVAAGTLTVACMVPAPGAMPQWQRGSVDAATGGVELASCARHAKVAASSYAFRLVAVLAAEAFGASAGITRVQVRLCADRALEHPVLTADIDRTSFVTSIYEHLRADDFAEPELTWGVSGLAQLLDAACLTYRLDAELGLTPLDRPEDASFEPDAARTVELWRDDRPLPPGLATLFRADRVADLDVFHVGDDPFAARVDAARRRAEEDPRAAAQQLADLIDMMALMDDVNGMGDEPAGEAPAGSDADAGAGAPAAGDGVLGAAVDAGAASASAAPAPARPRRRALYCSNYIARLAMALVEPDTAVRFRYVLDSVYDARVLLARLCTDNDDAEHGLAYAQQAIELGPTSPQAYIAAASALMELGEPARAAEELKRALRFDALPASFTYTYYRLAFALWHAGEPRAGLACYERALPNPRLRETTLEEMRALMASAGIRDEIAPGEIPAVLAQAGVPDAPADDIVELSARVLVQATDAGLLNLASLFARPVAQAVRDDALSAAVASLNRWAASPSA